MLALIAQGGAAAPELLETSFAGGALAATVGLGLVAALACLLPSGLGLTWRTMVLAVAVSVGSGIWFGGDQALPFHAPPHAH